MSHSTSSKNSILSYILILTSGILVRLLLIQSKTLCNWFRNRVEISTPLTSWNRVEEGIYLRSNLHQSSYDGDLVHEIPLMIRFYSFLIKIFTQQYIIYSFVLFDILNATLVHSISRKMINYLKRVETNNLNSGKYQQLLESLNNDEKKFNKFLIVNDSSFNTNYWALFSMSFYLFNPFNLSSCLGMSTVVVHNFILLLWLYYLINRNNVFISFLFLALHSNINVYTCVLSIASISFIIQRNNVLNRTQVCPYLTVAKYMSLFIVLASSLFGLNLYLENFNTRFIECTYLFILKVTDLVPNLGLFWYFFTEMFDHFIVFFTVVFQFNAFIYSIPLTLRLRNDPVVNILIQLGLQAVFKSYPNVGETGLYISLLPALAYLFPLMRNFLIYTCMLIASTVLAPIMFYLWLGSGGGNANFYFAITLVYSVGQIFLLVDVLYSNLKREFIKKNGDSVPKTLKDTLAIFSLE